jgi:TfoX/Sxy family transcriptional regulator of competence genes
MSFDEKLATRVREGLGTGKGITEKKMFGGIAFLLDGKMFCGVWKDELMVRVGPENHNKAVSQKHVRVMNHGGKPIVGFVFVASIGLKSKKNLAKWLDMGKAYALTLAKKK